MKDTTVIEVGAFEAKNRLSALVEMASQGKKIWITKHGHRMAPVLWIYEMVNLVKTAHKRKRLSTEHAMEAVNLLKALPVQLQGASDPEVRDRILGIALKHDLSAYDAGYFELADRLNVELFSNDRKLRDAFSSR